MGKLGEQDSNQLERFTSVVDPNVDPHLNGDYLAKNPTWHVEYSPWKANNIAHLLEKNKLRPQTVCEVGCGAGAVLEHLQPKLDPKTRMWGYDIAPPAIEMAKKRENDRLKFAVADFGEIETPRFDLLLCLEVVDHIEDYLNFMRMLKKRAEWKLFSFSLDISVQSAIREGAFRQRREDHGHLHHFSKEVVLGALKHTGYEVVDHFYPPNIAFGRLAKLAKPLRAVTFSLNPDMAVRMFGGYSFVVLAR